jgi:hypothetical protein
MGFQIFKIMAGVQMGAIMMAGVRLGILFIFLFRVHATGLKTQLYYSLLG